MTKEEFALACLGPLEAAYGSIEITMATMYYTMLADLPRDLLAASVAKCIVELKWLPKIAEIRAAAADITRGQVQEMSAHEAWGEALKAIQRVHPDVEGSLWTAKEKTPPLVWEAMQQIGMGRLLDMTTRQVPEVQKWFHEAYNGLLTRERKLLLAPPQVRQAIEEQRKVKELPPSEHARRLAGLIGTQE